MSRCLGVARFLFLFSGLILIVATTAALISTAHSREPVIGHASSSLTAFRSDAELRRFLSGLQSVRAMTFDVAYEAVGPALDDPVSQLPGSLPGIDSAGTAPPSRSITNTQEANVDEGSIVKARGDMLVILRRGRLFTVLLTRAGMQPVDVINAFPPGVSDEGDWYDEMLVSGDWIVVMGYSYARGGTEINRFRLSPDGHLRFEDAYHLKSDDYYSSRNYASRLIGNRLVFYAPLYLNWVDDPLEALPGIRKWREDRSRRASFRPIATARQIFVTPGMRNDREAGIDTLHAVTTCDLTAPELDCSAIGVLGPASRTSYVSASGVYLWMSEWTRRAQGGGESDAILVRMPFGSERPSAIGVRGAPVDQFSFREDARDGVINVLVRDQGGGDAMDGPEISGGRVALLRIPITEFGDGARCAVAARYRSLPSPSVEMWSFRNRFVGDHVLYSAGNPDEQSGRGMVVAVPVRGGEGVRLPIDHAVERIEVLGRDALVVGGGPRGSLGFTTVELSASGAAMRGDVFVLPAASEGETRSHAYFFRPATPDGASGLLGLPIARTDELALRRFGGAASMLFLLRDERRFARAGELDARVEGTVDDGCQASCTDWYGNARPIFLGNRIFALLGYELVEGALVDGRIREIRRIDFSRALNGVRVN